MVLFFCCYHLSSFSFSCFQFVSKLTFISLLISKISLTFAPKFDNNPLPNESQKHAHYIVSESSQPRDHLGTISGPSRDHSATIGNYLE